MYLSVCSQYVYVLLCLRACGPVYPCLSVSVSKLECLGVYVYACVPDSVCWCTVPMCLDISVSAPVCL
jgi:hypothetical protein